jgi:hypothetical protein
MSKHGLNEDMFTAVIFMSWSLHFDILVGQGEFGGTLTSHPHEC